MFGPGSQIVFGRNIRNNDVVIAASSAELVEMLNRFAGTSAADPEYQRRVTVQLLPIDYEFDASQLPLKIRTDLSLRGAGSEQTRIISTQSSSIGAKNIIECVDSWSSGSGLAGPCRNVTLEGFSIYGDAFAPIAIYTKGLQNSQLRDIHIRGMTKSGSIGVALHGEFAFGCYYNNLQSVDIGLNGAGNGAGIGFQLKTTDLATEPKRVNSNSLLMCSAKWCVDAGYELNGCVAITMTACEAEQQAVGLRVLTSLNTVVTGGYFENNTTGDIQLGTLSGAPELSQQTVLLQPILSSTNRLVGQGRGATGDVYMLSNDSANPGLTKYDGNWMDKGYIGSFACLFAEYSFFGPSSRVGYYKRSGDTNYRMEIYNDGKIRFGSGSAATDAGIEWQTATTCGTISAVNNCDFRVQGGWNTGRYRLGNYYLWVDATGNLRSHTSQPGSDTAGALIMRGTAGTTDNRLVRSDGTVGGTVKGSNATLDDTGNLTVTRGLVAGLGSFAVTTAFDVLVWQGGKLGFASAAVGIASTPDVYLVRLGASSMGLRGVSGVDASFSCGNLNSSGTINPGTLAVSALPSAAANAGTFVNVSDSNTQTIGDIVAGGGSFNVTVRSNGTDWIVWSGTAGGMTQPQVLARSFSRC